MGVANERKLIMPRSDHRTICRHGSSDAIGLKHLIGAIRDGISIDVVPTKTSKYAFNKLEHRRIDRIRGHCYVVYSL
jgi:hypothetical protein